MPIPRAKTKHGTTETILPQSLCGQNWFLDVNVRSPYQGYDKAERMLPALGIKTEVASRKEGLIDEFMAERDRVAGLRQQFHSLLTTSQKQNIDKYLDRAKIYIEDAEWLENAWRNGFIPFGADPVAAFPLSLDLEDIGQNEFCVNNFGYKSQNPFEPDCPTAEEAAGHNKDADKWRKLMVGAIINIRCAEEVIRKAEVKEENRLNKPDFGSISQVPVVPPSVGPGGIQAPKPPEHTLPSPMPTPMPTIPGQSADEPIEMGFQPTIPTSTSVDLGDDADADAVLEGEGEAPEDVVNEGGSGALETKRKKKSALPIVAAAGIGALLLLRK